MILYLELKYKLDEYWENWAKKVLDDKLNLSKQFFFCFLKEKLPDKCIYVQEIALILWV